MKGARKQHPTIVDIAELAGVAPMTVSRVINESGYVSAAMRERVQAAIKQLDYHPNGLARSLKRRRTQVIGILLPDIVNPFSGELARGIEEVLRARGYASFISTSERSTAREQEALRALVDHRTDGLIVATRETKIGNEYLERLTGRGQSIVAVGRQLNHPRIDRVTADHWKGGHDAVEHLLGLGHRRVGFIGVSLVSGAGLQRFQGYLDALNENDMPIRPELIVGPETMTGPGYSTQEDGYDGMQRLLALKERPTAVFARNDFTAMGAMCAIRDAGLRIPEEIAIVGFDNIPLSAYTAPPLTTVDQPTTEQGRRAAQLLLERIDGGDEMARREVSLDCHLIIRQSTRKEDSPPRRERKT